MAKIRESISVTIREEETSESSKKRLVVEITCDRKRITLPELLALEGAIAPLDIRIKEACIQEVLSFLDAGKSVLAAVRKSGSSEGSGKRGRRPRLKQSPTQEPSSLKQSQMHTVGGSSI